MPVASPHTPTVLMETIDQNIAGVDPKIPTKGSVVPDDQSLESITKEELKNKKLVTKGFVQGALRDFGQGDASKYNQLIGQITRKHHQPGAPTTVQLYIWILTLSECVSQLDKSCHELVVAVLQVDWAVRSSTFVEAYMRFMKNLVSAHSSYVVPALNAIVEGFRFRYQLPPYSTTTRSVTYTRHHQALQAILNLIPTASNSLYICIQRHIPYKQRSTADQAAYIKNVIEMMTYVPVLRKQIMALLIEHLVKIDAYIQIELDDLDEDIEFDTYSMNFDEDYHSDTSDDDDSDNDSETDEDDLDAGGSDVDSDFGEDDNTKQAKQMRMVRSMVRRLDSLMQLVFGHLAANTNATTPITSSRLISSAFPVMDLRTEMYLILLESFDRTVLKTLKSRYTQFLLFYFCSLDKTYADHFLDHLFHHLTDPLRPNVTRIAAAAYISSYVARAKFMEPATIQHAMTTLCGWCEQLLDQYESVDHIAGNTDRYEVFYASMQAMMYIFCFRWRDLVLQQPPEEEEEDDLIMEGINDHKVRPTGELHQMDSKKWCHGLRNMPRLLMNRLHPLKVCSSPVVRQFAKVAHQSHFMYIYPLLDKHKDLMIAGVNMNTTSETGARNLLHTVQTFFPFDPYKLEGSRKFIEDIYFEWIPQQEEDDDSDSDASNEGSDEEDEEEDDMSAGMTAMSISPNPTTSFW